MNVTAPRRIYRFAQMGQGRTASMERFALPGPISREWAWGGSQGHGVSVCVIDSGIEQDHPDVGEVCDAMTVQRGPGGYQIVPDDAGDVAGHGTACAGVIRRLAPLVRLSSIRILGPALGGDGDALVAALRWALDSPFQLINLSLSTRRPVFKEALHDLADRAYFGNTTIVASAHNSPVESYPWAFASVISVGSHSRPEPEYIEASPDPPVEFFAAGVDVEVPWAGGGSSRVSGNSFATPHVTGLLARIIAKHPQLSTPQLKYVLGAVADNLRPGAENPHD